LEILLTDRARDILATLRQSVASELVSYQTVWAHYRLRHLPGPEREPLLSLQDRLGPDEDAGAYSRLATAIRQVALVGVRFGLQLPQAISLGTVSSQTVNAHVITVDDSQSEYLLVFERELLEMIDLFSMFIASTLTDKPGQKLGASDIHELARRVDLTSLDDTIVYLTSKASYHVRDRDGHIGAVMVDLPKSVSRPESPLRSQWSQKIAALANASMIMFVVAHELIHVHQLHTRQHQDDGFREELFCDAEGAKLSWIVASYDFRPLRIEYCAQFAASGAPLFLSCLSLLEKSSHFQEHGELPHVLGGVDHSAPETNRLGSYPTGILRRIMARGALLTEFSRLNEPNGSAALWIDDLVTLVFEAYWQEYASRRAERFRETELVRRLYSSLMSTGDVPADLKPFVQPLDAFLKKRDP
jgi:hypothetical protein